MAIDASESFAHGSYADTDGVTFHGPPVHGFWEDRLAVSDRFIRPLFNAVLACAWRGDDASVPRVVSEWNEITGWADASGIQQLTPSDATALVEALQRVSEADLVPHLPASEAPAEYLRCAAVIAEFIHSRVDRGIPVYIEDD